MKKILFLVAGGGFQWESLTLADQLKEDWECHYVVGEVGLYPGSTLNKLLEGKNFLAIPEFSSRANSHLSHIVRNLWRTIRLLWEATSKGRPDVAVCLGSSSSIPIALVCRLRGIPVVFIESITRTDSLSATGRLLLRLHLADHFYVQWPEQEKLHPRACYRGTVL
jgi:beta-1,4-N-acetylglucosaminyltransferase